MSLALILFDLALSELNLSEALEGIMPPRPGELFSEEAGFPELIREVLLLGDCWRRLTSAKGLTITVG